jgi:hypothetical protein
METGRFWTGFRSLVTGVTREWLRAHARGDKDGPGNARDPGTCRGPEITLLSANRYWKTRNSATPYPVLVLDVAVPRHSSLM